MLYDCQFCGRIYGSELEVDRCPCDGAAKEEANEGWCKEEALEEDGLYSWCDCPVCSPELHEYSCNECKDSGVVVAVTGDFCYDCPYCMGE